MEIAKRLKKLRDDQKMSIAEISKRAGVPKSSYQEWEQGRKISNIEVYLKLAHAYQVDLNYLLLGVSNDDFKIELKAELTDLNQKLQKIIEKI